VTPELYAGRAARAYAAMQRGFRTRGGRYRRDGRWRLPGAAAHLWPFARALVATLDLAGVPAGPVDGFDADAQIAGHLRALEDYWDHTGDLPAYASDVTGTWFGGDRYYDDNAWVGLGLIQLERMRPGPGRTDRAAELLRFAIGGWDARVAGVPSPGGVFWVEQGKGVGARNHDRNTVSNAPNAQLGLHLRELGRAGATESGPVGPEQMYAWVNQTLDAGLAQGAPGTGLFWDKIRGDGSFDRKFWSYNQGSMVGLNVLLARAGGDSTHLSLAEAITRNALREFAGGYAAQPAAFNAILFRNLLQLHAATADASLQSEILAAMRSYGEELWAAPRDRYDCVRLAGAAPTLLDQSAVVQVLALLAWDPGDYGKLA
jgi:hypothetical protein